MQTQDGQVLLLGKCPCKSSIGHVVQILQPFEVRNGDATCVQIQVRDDQNLLKAKVDFEVRSRSQCYLVLYENLVRCRGNRAVLSAVMT